MAGSTYNGFSGPGGSEPPRRPPPAAPVQRSLPQVSRKTMILGGVGAAVLAGLAFGLWARPPHDRLGATAEAATPASVPIEVNRPQPLPMPASTGRMEVLPGDMAQAARVSAPAALPRTPRAEVGLPQDVSVVAPEVDDPPEARWAPPEQRLSRAERRAMREQRWADEQDARDDRRFERDMPPPPEEDGDQQ